MAMFKNGMCLKYYRNPVLKAFSAGLPTTLKYLDEIYESTRETRESMIKQQHIAGHSSDDYQEYHPFKVQREGTPGIMHTGMVYNLVRAREYLKPIGTILRNTDDGSRWEVLSCHMPDYWTCNVQLMRSEIPFAAVERSVKLPSVRWLIESIPGESPLPSITYLDQSIPSSLRMRVPRGATHSELVMGSRDWQKSDEGSLLQLESLNPRTYMDLVQAARRLREFLRYNSRNQREFSQSSSEAVENDTTGSDRTVSELFSKFNEKLLLSPDIVPNVDSFQVDCQRYWNQAYDAVDQYMWFPICPREETKTDEALLAMINIFEEIGLIVKDGDHNYVPADTIEQRTIFHYGDVLTIKKWYSFSFVHSERHSIHFALVLKVLC